MATIRKNRKLREADQMLDQNMTQAPAQPATQDDLAAAPAQPIDMPAVDEQAEPVADEGAAEDSPIQVDPETVSMEVKVPTDQLAAAVAQSTGDMEPAEIAPDAMANQEADLVSAVDTGTEEAAPVEQPAEEQPVMESKKVNSKKIKEADESMGELEAAEAAEKHDQDKLEDIIDTGVGNMGDSIGTTDATDDGQNRLDLIKDGVDNMTEALGDIEEDAIKNAGVTTAEEIDEEAEAAEAEEAEDEGEEEEEEADFDFLDDVPGLEEGEGLDDIDDEFSDLSEPDTEEFLSNVEDFLAQEDTEDVVDALQTTASFLSQIARKPGEEALDFDKIDAGEEPSEDDELFADADEEEEEPEVDFDEGDFDEEDFDDMDFDEEEDDIEDDDVDARLEDFLANSKKYESNPLKGLVNYLLNEKRQSMRGRMSEKVSNVADRKVTKVISKQEPLKESIIYPAGSEPASTPESQYPAGSEMVRRQESDIRREAIKNYRQTLIRERESKNAQPQRRRFNEALRSSAQSVKRSESNDTWENDNFTTKYKERLDFNELLKNHYLG